MKKVLFAGDINVDVMMGGMESLPMVDREVSCETYEVVMGASTVLCACAYSSLGGDASFAGLAGNDDYGEFMMRGLEDFGIDTSRIRRTTSVKTGVTVNLIYRNTRTQVTYPGTIAAFEGPEISEQALAGFSHIHCAGVYLQHRFRPRITALLELAGRMGITTSIDPQWDGKETWEHMDGWLPLLTWLFVNQDEALSITKAATVEDALRRLAERTRQPLVKLGKEGALLLVDGCPKPVPTREVQVVDTTGAGDSFDAGFLYATLEKGMSPVEAAAFGNAVATRSCLFVGGVNARSSYRDIVEWLGGSLGQ